MKWYKYSAVNMPEALYDKYLSAMSDERKEYVFAINNKTDKKLTVAAEMLIKKAVSEFSGITEEEIIVIKDAYGKPYAKGINVHFSISHSGDYAVCAIDEKPIGIDIEKHRPLKIKTAERFSNPDELDFINGAMPDEQKALSRFFEIWTAKEAAYKMQGGINPNFKSIDTLKLNKKYINFSDYTLCIVYSE